MTSLEFEDVKNRIEQLYIIENQSLKTVIKELEADGFHRTERAYKERLKKWGWRKNVKHAEIAPFLSNLRLREPDEGGRRQRLYNIRGHEMSRQKVRWHWNLDRKKREAQRENGEMDEDGTESAIDSNSLHAMPLKEPDTPLTARSSAVSPGFSANASTIDLDEPMDETTGHPEPAVPYDKVPRDGGYPGFEVDCDVVLGAFGEKNNLDRDMMQYLAAHNARDLSLPAYAESAPDNTKVLARTPIKAEKAVYTPEFIPQRQPLQQQMSQVREQAPAPQLAFHQPETPSAPMLHQNVMGTRVSQPGAIDSLRLTTQSYPTHHDYGSYGPFSQLPVAFNAWEYSTTSSYNHPTHAPTPTTPYSAASQTSSHLNPLSPASYLTPTASFPAFNPAFNLGVAPTHQDTKHFFPHSESTSGSSSGTSSRMGSDTDIAYQHMLPQAFGWPG